MPVGLERVGLDDRRAGHPAPERGEEVGVLLDRHQLARPGSASASVSPPGPGPDLQHGVGRSGAERVGDALEDPAIGEEVLAEPPLGPRHLRSGAPGACGRPPAGTPKASAVARTACTIASGDSVAMGAHLR